MCMHFSINNKFISIVVSSIVANILNILHTAYQVGFNIRPADLALWMPINFIIGMFFIFPICLITSLILMKITQHRNKLRKTNQEN